MQAQLHKLFKLRVVQVRQRNHPAVGNADCGVLFVSFQLFREDGSRWIHGFASNSNGSTMIRPIISGSRDSRLVLSCFFARELQALPTLPIKSAGSSNWIHQGINNGARSTSYPWDSLCRVHLKMGHPQISMGLYQKVCRPKIWWLYQFQ